MSQSETKPPSRAARLMTATTLLQRPVEAHGFLAGKLSFVDRYVGDASTTYIDIFEVGDMFSLRSAYRASRPT